MRKELADEQLPSRAEAASTVTSTEEARAFFQARLAAFGFGLFVLAGGSWLALAVAYFLGPGDGAPGVHAVDSIGSLLHLGNALLAGGLWLAARRGRRRGAWLHALDIGVSLGLIAIWGSTGVALPDRAVGGYISLLSFTLGILARAIVVPSTARLTLLIGVLGAAIITGCAAARPAPDQPLLQAIVATVCWSISAVAISWFASRTIYGLRRAVQEARVLGQYTLETKLGEGGMGSVWRASHALLRRPTAVKLLPAGRMGELAIRRFEREVQLTALLTHPNTVAIYDYGRTRDGIFYYAMELVEGTDLERLVARYGPQPPGRVVHLLIQICGALAEAHDLGLVHRDVKPANVLLALRRNEHEFAKIVDFGLVKSVDSGADDATVTAINTITGTPLYLAPEAIRAPESVDARSDLYALGALAWFLLAGRPVFEGESIVAICSQHLHEIPLRPSAVLQKAIPRDLEDIVLSCLEKRPEDRPGDGRSLRRKLEACQSATDWSADQAAEWWQAYAGELRSAGPGPSTTRTVALDLTQRAMN